MALESGHGGTVTGPTWAAEIRSWTLIDKHADHDITVMGATGHAFIPGLPRWEINLEAVVDDQTNFTTDGGRPGDSVAITLKATSAAADSTYEGTAFIDEINFTRDVTRESVMNARLLAGSVLTRPDNTV